MTDYDRVYNELAEKQSGDGYLFIQDGALLDEPMIRDMNELLECERDEVQKMLEADTE